MGWLKDLFSVEEEKEEKKTPEEPTPKPENILSKKWITMEISLWAPFTELVNLKNALKNYSDELSWEIESGTKMGTTLIKEDGSLGGTHGKTDITIHPKNYLISPEKFLKEKQKILGFAFAIHRDLFFNRDHDKARNEFKKMIEISSRRTEGKKPNKKDFTLTESISVMSYSYKIMDRVNLEKQNKNVALELFGSSIEEDLRSLFQEEKEIKSTKPAKTKKKVSKKQKEMLDKLKISEEDLLNQSMDLEKSHNKLKQELEEVFSLKL